MTTDHPPFEVPCVPHADLEALAAMRERKLRRLRFRRPPAPGRVPGQPADFLTQALIAEFAIPEAPPVSANEYGGPFIAEIRASPDKLCLDVGAGLRRSCFANVVNTEIYPSLSTDILCVGEDLPFESDQFDYAICAAVLEHTRRPWDVAREICRVLKPGGRVLVDFPFLQPVHGYPHHYFNATPGGCTSLFEPYCDIEVSKVGDNNHPIQALHWLLRDWRDGLAPGAAEHFTNLTVSDLLATPPDQQLASLHCTGLTERALQTIPAGSTMIARKRATVPEEPDASALTHRIDALETEVRLLRASHSWRLTAPIRALTRLLRRPGALPLDPAKG